MQQLDHEDSCNTSTRTSLFMSSQILIIEDDPLFSRLIEHALSTEYSVTIKENGLEAILWLKANNIPSLIIADLNMPEMNGYELIGKLKSDPTFSKIPLIIISGEDNSLIKNRCYRTGANRFYAKPINMTELKSAVEELMLRTQKVI